MTLIEIDSITNLFKWLATDKGLSISILIFLVLGGSFAVYKFAKWAGKFFEKYLEEKRQQHNELKQELKDSLGKYSDYHEALDGKIQTNNTEIKENRQEIKNNAENANKVLQGLQTVKEIFERETPKISGNSNDIIALKTEVKTIKENQKDIKNQLG